MKISTTGEGLRTIIVAENQAVKQMIESNLSQLRDSMAGQGLKIDSFEVLVGGDGSSGLFKQGDQSEQADEEFEDFVDSSELEVELNEEKFTPDKFYDFSQTVSFIA